MRHQEQVEGLDQQSGALSEARPDGRGLKYYLPCSGLPGVYTVCQIVGLTRFLLCLYPLSAEPQVRWEMPRAKHRGVKGRKPSLDVGDALESPYKKGGADLGCG